VRQQVSEHVVELVERVERVERSGRSTSEKSVLDPALSTSTTLFEGLQLLGPNQFRHLQEQLQEQVLPSLRIVLRLLHHIRIWLPG
jgi:hypothetical protein